ncbi:MAG: dihydrofolate reductase [Bacteroidales bacterium]
MKIALIAAIDINRGIGKNNKLLCHLPADLKKFKQLTTGHSIIMGRKTYESLPNGALPNRKNIVITSNPEFEANGCYMAHSPEMAIKLCQGEDEVFIIGGEKIYLQFINMADVLYITKIDHAFEADSHFPVINSQIWQLTENLFYPSDEKNAFGYYFQVYIKLKS